MKSPHWQPCLLLAPYASEPWCITLVIRELLSAFQGPYKALQEPYKALKEPHKALKGPYKALKGSYKALKGDPACPHANIVSDGWQHIHPVKQLAHRRAICKATSFAQDTHKDFGYFAVPFVGLLPSEGLFKFLHADKIRCGPLH